MVRDGRIVGIVSRADLVRALAAAEPVRRPPGGLLSGALPHLTSISVTATTRPTKSRGRRRRTTMTVD